MHCWAWQSFAACNILQKKVYCGQAVIIHIGSDISNPAQCKKMYVELVFVRVVRCIKPGKVEFTSWFLFKMHSQCFRVGRCFRVGLALGNAYWARYAADHLRLSPIPASVLPERSLLPVFLHATTSDFASRMVGFLRRQQDPRRRKTEKKAQNLVNFDLLFQPQFCYIWFL